MAGAAPGLPDIPERPDLVMMLDMLHYLDNDQLQETLTRACKLLTPGGLLVARFVIRPPAKRSFYWYVEDFRSRFAGVTPSYRTGVALVGMMNASGFDNPRVSASANSELFWLVGQAGEKAGPVAPGR